MKKPHTIIAETLSADSADIMDYRYENFRYEDARVMYWIGDKLYCIGKRAPVIAGFKFEQHQDQMFAGISGTILWVGVETDEAA
jgi:hypothetical protein